tara:strand:+ start:435 stop:695 length:261 start_codon:yes stop_codon:yes gene_type:complete
VQALTTISDGMDNFMREGFEKAIIRDMSFEMRDEEGMFHLFVFELIAEEFKNVVDIEVMSALKDKLIDALFDATSPLMEVFQEEWA